jgi:SAM-dependent methyltransferase
LDADGVSTTSTMSDATNKTATATTPAAAAVACPVCGSGDISMVGRPLYRQPTKVAGVRIDVSDLDLTWRRCGACGYQFIYPGIPEERLLACYASAVAGHWGTDDYYGVVRFYDQKKRVLEQFAPGKRVVDFGCFDGGFLAYLGAGYEKFGIEPSADAARVAQSRGVTILGATAAAAVQSASAQRDFDAIVSFDVFEHLTDPVATLRDLKQLLRPGGIILIETGNTDTPLWRRLGIRYAYTSYVEHVGLFNCSSIAAAGRRAGLSLAHFQRSAHHVIRPRHWIACRLYNAAYWVLRGIDAVKIPVPVRWRQAARGPLPHSTAADHFLAVLRVD